MWRARPWNVTVSAFARDVLRHGLRVIDLPAQLVEVNDLQVRPELDLAGVRRELAEQELEQGRLAAAVRADDADLVAAPDGRAEVAHDRPLAVGEADVPRLDDLLAGKAARLNLDARGAFALAPLATFLAHLEQRAHAALVAGAPGPSRPGAATLPPARASCRTRPIAFPRPRGWRPCARGRYRNRRPSW